MKYLKHLKKLLLGFFLIYEGTFCQVGFSAAQDKRFENFEIRVIRPKYFSKSSKFELGAQASIVTNQTFIYTFLATGLATMHFSESIGAEASISFGGSIDKGDKTLLKEEFDINTIILRTQYIATGAVLWTPIYGKFQTDEGSLIYFDTFISLGGGMTGVNYTYDHCADPSEAVAGANLPDVPAETTVSYPTFIFGMGQRFFIDKKTAIRWDIRGNFFSYNVDDGDCDQEAIANGEGSGLTNSQQNVIIQIGTSKFF